VCPKRGSFKAAEGRTFVRKHIEDGEQLRDLQEIADLFCQVQHFQVSIPVFHGGEGANEFADSGTIDIIHVRKIQKDLHSLVVQQPADRFSQQSAAIAERYAAAQVHNGNLSSVAMRGVKSHLIPYAP
jgi:hypothetical protein